MKVISRQGKYRVVEFKNEFYLATRKKIRHDNRRRKPIKNSIHFTLIKKII